jgi:amino-acid N-acetyltransferase
VNPTPVQLQVVGSGGQERSASTSRTSARAYTTPEPQLERTGAVTLRPATVAEAGAIHTLIAEHLAEGHLLPRQLEEVAIHAHRFIVAVQQHQVVACAELAPLSRDVAEVRSLVVHPGARRAGLSRQMLDELVRRAAADGFSKLCAFTHAPACFVHLGFSIVPHVWVPEKIVTDCSSCAQFRRCGQYAVVRSLGRGRHG